jgi:hypothetical protein
MATQLKKRPTYHTSSKLQIFLCDESNAMHPLLSPQACSSCISSFMFTPVYVHGKKLRALG